MSSGPRPAPSPLVARPSQHSSTIYSLRNSSNSVAQSARSKAGSFAGSVKQTTKDAMDADVPLGAWAAAAETTAKAPTIGDIRQGNFSNNGWSSKGQDGESNDGRMRRASSGSSGRIPKLRSAAGAGIPQVDDVQEHQESEKQAHTSEHIGALDGHSTPPSHVPETNNTTTADGEPSLSPIDSALSDQQPKPIVSRDQRVPSSGWRPPPKLPWKKSWGIGLKTFGKWVITPFGFFWTIYGLNVVAWGGMLFLLLCGAAPEMCWAPIGNGEYVRDCNHIDSPRRVWLEIDSQILTGLFCVTGFGLLPWRARDMYFLLRWRLCSEKKHGYHKKMYGLRRLAGYYRSWLRLPGSETLDQLTLTEYLKQSGLDPQTHNNSDSTSSTTEEGTTDPRFPLPLTKTPNPPLTGIRSPPTTLWKVDFYIWCNMLNTFFQASLCGIMWGMNRYVRPSWTTGFLIACACVIAGVGGIVAFKEGKKVKKVEGVNPSPAVMAELWKMGLGPGLELNGAGRVGLEGERGGKGS